MHRTEYVIKRIAFALMTVFVAITINFLLFHALPGSAVTSALRSPHAYACPSRRAHARVRPGSSLCSSSTSSI